VAVWIESEKIAEGLDSDDRAGNRILFRNGIQEENLQRFPGAAAQISKKLPIIEKVTAEDLRDAENEVPVGYFFDPGLWVWFIKGAGNNALVLPPISYYQISVICLASVII
jgi:hypothetical protein